MRVIFSTVNYICIVTKCPLSSGCLGSCGLMLLVQSVFVSVCNSLLSITV